jgi:hypothetical protein
MRSPEIDFGSARIEKGSPSVALGLFYLFISQKENWTARQIPPAFAERTTG